jgi:hypothetical protein
MTARIDHDRAFELIPWLVNDTLASSERAALEAHVRDCLPCRIELKEQRSLSAAVLAQPTVHTSAARGFDRLLEQLDGTPEPRHDTPPRTRALAARRPRRLAAAGAVFATAALAALVFVAGPRLVDERAPSGYTTLADTPAPGTAAGVELDLVFAESLSPDERQRLLEELGAAVVAGPSAIGRYRVRLESERSGEDLTRLLAELNADARVRFAGRAFAAEPR